MSGIFGTLFGGGSKAKAPAKGDIGAAETIQEMTVNGSILMYVSHTHIHRIIYT